MSQISRRGFVAGSAMVINIVSNMVLIPRLEAVGSAISSICTQFIAAIVQIIVVQRVFKFKPNYRLIFTFILFVIGVAGINYFSKYLNPNWMVNFAVMVCCCGFWAFVTGMISIKAIFRLVKIG